MSVAVYPRLGDVLAARNMTIPELGRQIEERFGLSMKPTALYWLMLGEEPIQRIDLQVVGAAAAVLNVTLDDLFSVETTPNGSNSSAGKPILGLDDSKRLTDLFDRQGRQTLSEADEAELERLVAKYARLLHDRRLREIADKRGVSVEQARREAEEQVDEALDQWHVFNSDSQNRRALSEQMKQRRAQQAK